MLDSRRVIGSTFRTPRSRAIISKCEGVSRMKRALAPSVARTNDSFSAGVLT
ncbi:hypothetical protein D3C84_995850 [compost metagenome]